MPRLFLLALFLTLSSTPQAETTAVELQVGVEGILETPVGVTKKVVLLLHGWNADMNEVGNLYADLALQLADRDIASFRISFSGEGSRTGYVVSSTFDSRVGEAEAALQYVKEKFPKASLGVQGYSLGGLTAMGLVGRYPDSFETMVLWAAAAQMRITGDALYDAAAREAMKEGSAVYKSWTDITLTREFISGFVGVNVESNLARYTGALLTIRGDQDFLPRRDVGWLKLAPTDDKAFILMGGADHLFHVLDETKPSYSESLLSSTVNWFDRTL